MNNSTANCIVKEEYFNNHNLRYMKKTVSIATLAIALSAVTLTVAGCSSDGKTGSDSGNATVSNFPIDLNVKSSSANYHISTPGDSLSYYLTLSAAVQWPERIGDTDLTHLQDTILALTFTKERGNDIDRAISDYVSDASTFELGTEVERIDSIPTDADVTQQFYASITGAFESMNSEVINYTVDFSQYLGGAHPNSGSMTFTYLLGQNKLVTTDWLFADGYERVLNPILYDAIAQETGMTLNELMHTLFTPNVAKPDDVYLEDGAIVFHYNPYTILPYSFGQIAAKVYPFAVESVLTPEANEYLTR